MAYKENPLKILFCDWNNTLLDDMLIWDKARRETFLAFGKEPSTIAEYFRELESGDYLEVYRKRDITASREELNAIYESVYETGLYSVRLFPGVKETLLRLKECGICLVLITVQSETLVFPLLDKFGIGNLFKHHVFHTLDKKVEITRIIQEYNTDPKECYFVGDSPSDMRHAKEAGVVAIAFLAGHIPEDLMKTTNAEHYIHTFEEMFNLII